MFIDDEKAVRNHRRKEGRAALYITITALAACILMFVGLMNVARAAPLDDERGLLEEPIGGTYVSLDLRHSGRGDDGRLTRVADPAFGLPALDGIDLLTTAATGPARDDDDDAASIDRRLAMALGLAAFIVVAGVGQMVGRNTDGSSGPGARWRSEA